MNLISIFLSLIFINLYQIPSTYQTYIEKSQNTSSHDPNDVIGLQISSDGSKLITASSSKILIINSSNFTQEIEISSSSITCLSFSPNESYIAVGKSDNKVVVYNYPSNSQLVEISGHNKPLRSVIFSSDSNKVISGSDKQIIIYDIALQSQQESPIQNAVFGLAISSANNAIFASGEANDIVIRNMSDGSQIQLHPNGASVNGMAFNQDGSLIIVNNSNNLLVKKTADLSDVSTTWNGTGNTHIINQIQFTPDFQFLMSASGSDFVVWDFASKTSLQRIAATSIREAVIFQDQFVYTGHGVGKIIIWQNCIDPNYTDNSECKACDEWISNCNQCNNYNDCQSCLDGYYKQSVTSCQQCSQPCKTCISNGSTCVTCFDTHIFDGVNQCLLCGQQIQNCKICQSLTVCQECVDYYFVSGGNCVQCTAPCKNCENIPTKCTSCISPYVYGNSTCKLCAEWKENCQICTDSEKCEKCNQGFYLDSSKSCLKCDKILGNQECKECGEWIEHCLECSDHQTCVQCKEDFVFIEGTCQQLKNNNSKESENDEFYKHPGFSAAMGGITAVSLAGIGVLAYQQKFPSKGGQNLNKGQGNQQKNNQNSNKSQNKNQKNKNKVMPEENIDQQGLGIPASSLLNPIQMSQKQFNKKYQKKEDQEQDQYIDQQKNQQVDMIEFDIQNKQEIDQALKEEQTIQKLAGLTNCILIPESFISVNRSEVKTKNVIVKGVNIIQDQSNLEEIMKEKRFKGEYFEIEDILKLFKDIIEVVTLLIKEKQEDIGFIHPSNIYKKKIGFTWKQKIIGNGKKKQEFKEIVQKQDKILTKLKKIILKDKMTPNKLVQYFSPEEKDRYLENNQDFDDLLEIDYEKSQVFSIGLIIIEALTMHQISGFNHNKELFEKKMDYLEAYFEEQAELSEKKDFVLQIQELVKKMVVWDPEKRIKIEDIQGKLLEIK